MQRGPTLLFAIFAVLFAEICPALAADKVSFAVVEWGGLTYRDEAGKPAGPWYDIMLRLVEETGLEAELLPLPLPRIFRRLDHGETDLTLFTTNIGDKVLKVTPETTDGYHRVALVHDRTGIVVVTRKAVDIETYADMHGMRAAIGIGGCCFAGFSDNDAIQKVEVPDQVILKMLLAGRVDAGVLLDLDYYYYVTKAGFDRTQFSAPVLTTPLEAWIHRRSDFTDEAVLSKVRAAADRLRQAGVFDRILADYRPGS